MEMEMGDDSEVLGYGRLKEELETKYKVAVLDEAITCAQDLLLHNSLSATFPADNVEEKLRHLLTEACELTLSRVHDNVDVKELDRIHYKLHQILVEQAELVKEKEPCSQEWLLRLHQELDTEELNLLPILNRLWDPSSGIPECIQKLETSCHTLLLSLETADLYEISHHLFQFLKLLVQFLQLIRPKFRHIMAVDHSRVEEVVSRFTNVPIPRLPTNLVNKFPEVTRQRLCMMMVEKDHVITTFINSLKTSNSKEEWQPRLGRAFLFLGPAGVGKTCLAKAIALLFYGDLNHLNQIDTSVLTQSDLSRLADDVATGQHGIILFDKVDRANPVVLENITDILARDGFSKTIIMTSSVGSEHLDNPVRGNSEWVVDEARKFFKPELMDIMDGILVFGKMYSSQINVARLLLRDWARSANERNIAVNLSDDIASIFPKKGMCNGHDVEKWLAENTFPTLNEVIANCRIDETCAVYVDTLVGSRELSFRVESSLGNLVEDWYSERTNRSLRKLMAVYWTDREVINLTLKLDRICSDLKDKLNDGTFSKEVVSGIEKDEVAFLISSLKDLLLSYQKSLGLISHIPEMDAMSVGTEINNHQKKVAKKEVQILKDKLPELVKGQNVAIGIITHCVLRSISSTHPPSRPCGVYLFLGLDRAGKIRLEDDVLEHVGAIEGEKPLVKVDLSDYSSSQSLLFGDPPRNGCDCDLSLSVVEAVRRWPYCVVVFDKIEEVEASVYSTLLRVLDTGILHCIDGATVDFRWTTIILISDLGNKKIIAKYFRSSYEDIECSVSAITRGGCRFRSELLNRVDDVIFCNPTSPTEFFGLSKRMAGAVRRYGCGAMARAGFRNFEKSENELEQLRRSIRVHHFHGSTSSSAPRAMVSGETSLLKD